MLNRLLRKSTVLQSGAVFFENCWAITQQLVLWVSTQNISSLISIFLGKMYDEFLFEYTKMHITDGKNLKTSNLIYSKIWFFASFQHFEKMLPPKNTTNFVVFPKILIIFNSSLLVKNAGSDKTRQFIFGSLTKSPAESNTFKENCSTEILQMRELILFPIWLKSYSSFCQNEWSFGL